jgi:hypothetical protein
VALEVAVVETMTERVVGKPPPQFRAKGAENPGTLADDIETVLFGIVVPKMF